MAYHCFHFRTSSVLLKGPEFQDEPSASKDAMMAIWAGEADHVEMWRDGFKIAEFDRAANSQGQA